MIDVSIDGKAAVIGDRKYFVERDQESGARAPMRIISEEDYRRTSARRIDPNSARCRAYRDLYALVFSAIEGDLPLFGDQTVVHELIKSGYLLYNPDCNSFSIASPQLVSELKPSWHAETDGRMYRACCEELR